MQIIKIIFLLLFLLDNAAAQDAITGVQKSDVQKSSEDNQRFLESNLSVIKGGVGGVADVLVKNNTTGSKDAKEVKGRIMDGIGALSLIGKAQSLMFDADESGNVERAIESLKTNQVYKPEDEEELDKTVDDKKKKEMEELAKLEEKKVQESEKSYIYLSSLMYFNSNEWVVWINNQKITPKTNKSENELYLTLVEKDKVKLLWTLSISKWRIISGQKNESFAPKINSNNQVEVEFELMPNQTFVLSQNTVVEGRAVISLFKKRGENRVKKIKAIVEEESTKDS